MTNLSNNGMVIDMGNVFLLFSIYTSHAMNYIIMYVLYLNKTNTIYNNYPQK